MHIKTQAVDRFFEIESLGVNCTPRCGACSCGKCHPGGKSMSLKEENELKMIEEGIQFDSSKGRWCAGYPWIKEPSELKPNRKVAVAKLISLEKRLQKNQEYREVYACQIQDMLDRKAARLVTQQELENYQGPTYYIAHHAVLKPESKSTPCRIVFDSKAQYMGLSLNECLAKGPSLLNLLLGVILRFRQERVAFIGDISKMYHSIDIPLRDQMMHLFVWRGCKEEREPETYAITAVNMGDRPSATIAQSALRKTAEMAIATKPEAAKIIIHNAYMDDIPASVDDSNEAVARMEEIDAILEEKGFKIKEWIHNITGEEPEKSDKRGRFIGLEDNSGTEGVLGLRWEVDKDVLRFKFKTLKKTYAKISKRSILSETNSIYDPAGVLSPFTIKAKILLRTLWAHEPKLGWDTPVPDTLKNQWECIRNEIPLLTKLSFLRALKTEKAFGKPTLVLFSDGSENAYGAVAYVRWRVSQDRFESRLVMAKSRVAPLKTVDVVRIELCGALLSVRLRGTIQKEMTWEFERIIHLTDSEIVHAMIHKQSYGFNTFVANRVGEIQQMSKVTDWAWLPGKVNIADVITRGCSPVEINEDSIWQQGPSFLKKEVKDWPVRFEVNQEVQVSEKEYAKKKDVPSDKFIGMMQTSQPIETLANRIDETRFSKWKLLKGTTARILKLYKRFRSSEPIVERDISVSDLQEAESFWIKDAQSGIDLKRHQKLKPEIVEGVIMVGGRTERWMSSTWNRQKFILLPKQSHISKLIADYEHKQGGCLGLLSSISKIRSKYWIIGIRVIMKQIIRNCRRCKEKNKERLKQIMSPLPIERIKPSPAFHAVGVDYFGPFQTRGEVQKRTRGKSYGAIFSCLSSRAVYADVAHDLSTDGFLQVLRRFSSLRGWPAKIHADQGTQFIGASNEMKKIVKEFDWLHIRECSMPFKTEWEFSPPDGKWYNGATEALVKSVKRALSAAIGENVLSFSELQTCVFEAAELVNERPIGLHPHSPEEGVYLCPNDLILGRASNHVPQGPFLERNSNKNRFDFLQSIVNTFWKCWVREVFPRLVIEPKWHTEHRNLSEGDVVLVEDANPVRGKWKLGKVEKPIISQDGKVRRVELSHITQEGSRSIAERPVQKLILISPKDN